MKETVVIGNNARVVNDGNLKYIQFECFDKFENRLIHCMSTRQGGISEGECSTLNLGFNRNDSRENVIANYKTLCESVGIKCKSLVFSNQVHGNKLKVVNKNDKGKGFCRESDIIGYDGLVTNTPGVTLVTFYADCVPIFLYDSSRNVAALVHSGWKSTFKEIAAEAVKVMKDGFGCLAGDIVAAIGPSINKCCFEVDEDVYKLFAEKYDITSLYTYCSNKKWKINLQGIIENTLLGSGVLKNNIYQSNICTKCNRDLFFSHRGDAGKTGSLAAFMQLRETLA